MLEFLNHSPNAKDRGVTQEYINHIGIPWVARLETSLTDEVEHHNHERICEWIHTITGEGDLQSHQERGTFSQESDNSSSHLDPTSSPHHKASHSKESNDTSTAQTTLPGEQQETGQRSSLSERPSTRNRKPKSKPKLRLYRESLDERAKRLEKGPVVKHTPPQSVPNHSDTSAINRPELSSTSPIELDQSDTSSFVMAPDFPRIFLLSTRLSVNELHELENQTPTLTYDINEANVVVGNISQAQRAKFELRKAKLETVPIESPQIRDKKSQQMYTTAGTQERDPEDAPSSKRRRVAEPLTSDDGDIIKVVKLAWLKDSFEHGTVLPVEKYLLYQGKKVSPKDATPTSATVQHSSTTSILERARQDQQAQPARNSPRDRPKHRSHTSATSTDHVPSLLHQTTSEHDITLPSVPDFLETPYSCQRPTPMNPPNEAFVEALIKVRIIRQLQGDEVGVRAYSTSIATVSAYPHKLQNTHEVERLPGCGAKIAELWREWNETGELTEVRKADADPMVSVLRLFYNIWGVGDTTAREFYRKGWRDLNDLVDFTWDSLSRSQQVGVKFYDEFLLKIPRDEVESIGAVILKHAREIDLGFEMVIAGGYRRGKLQCGDIDVILSHRDENKTLRVVNTLIQSLEQAQFITHNLVMSLHNSERGQRPVSWKGEGASGSGFDTLDKAMVVWQDPSQEDAPHRRVDIIISPWKTVGCALLGWSGGTTFQRDLRRYCKKVKGLKFDSSGVRRRSDGMWVDLEKGPAGDGAPDMETAERRVFEGLGLTWRPPEERCTG
ncbi:hypothetical protein MRS44_014616 [Fusarium solani]|uniref:uncharacterized protein n=1 Tax=Fusarium solani TaxID=169388 RepID=UPI0032C48D29|nr:hypothetical protein MRS44_014616 [Fusarium solani]